jgi:hypothetical protein
VCVLDKLYFQRSSAHTFDTLYCVKSATPKHVALLTSHNKVYQRCVQMIFESITCLCDVLKENPRLGL